MRIQADVFNSRFARRLFVLFIASALLPTLVLAVLSFRQVSEHLSDRHHRQLHQEVKSLGQGILERLHFLSSEMDLVETFRENGGSDLPQKARLSEKFTSLSWADRDETVTPLLGTPRLSPPHLEELLGSPLAQDTDSFVQIIHDAASRKSRIFLIKPARSSSLSGHLIGEVKHSYLWNTISLGAQQRLCITAPPGTLLFCELPKNKDLLPIMSNESLQNNSGSLEWQSDGKGYIAGYRNVFLGAIDPGMSWRVIISEPKSDFLQPVEDFKKNFFYIVALSLLIVMALSIRLIERILAPLRKLHEATQHLGKKGIESRVSVDSDDEFKELAESFNSMADRLAEQLRSLETIVAIDRLTLADTGTENLIEELIAKTHEMIPCDLMGVILADDADQFRTLIFKEKGHQTTGSLPMTLSQEAVYEVAAHPDGMILGPEASLPPYLGGLSGYAMAEWLIIPLPIDGKISAILTLGYKAPAPLSESSLSQAREWANRFTSALSSTRRKERLYRQAHYDSLTGLANRSSMKEHLLQAIERAKENKTLIAMLFIDMDRFKLINDSLGHFVGDQYLVKIAQRINRCVGDSGTVARIGGDEFTIVVPDLAPSQYQSSLARLLKDLLSIVQQPIYVSSHELRTTASVGISLFPDDADNIIDLMKSADTAMYSSKQAGGNNYRYFSSHMNLAAKQRLTLEAQLRHALLNDEFEIFYQPKVSVASGEITGAEALVRWRHPAQGLISPATFIPVAEESALIAELDKWVFDAVCVQLQAWSAQHIASPQIAVNFSAKRFQEDNLTQQLLATLQNHAIPVSSLSLEITEGALIGDMDKALNVLGKLKEAGFTLAIDDFGTGYSSLAYLKQMPIHKLKVDQSFVRHLSNSSTDAAIVTTIIRLAHELGLSCIAEGVETQDELDFLSSHHCEEYQGFYFSQPLTADEFITLFLGNTRTHAAASAIAQREAGQASS